jgi:hypothetical protein
VNKLETVTLALAKACDGNPVTSIATIMLFYLMFSLVEATVEKLIYGERFVHWLDPFFMCAFIAYSAYAVWWCALWNSAKAAA